MVYLLQKFRQCLLGGPFKFFTNHYSLKYLVKKHVLKGWICYWNGVPRGRIRLF